MTQRQRVPTTTPRVYAPASLYEALRPSDSRRTARDGRALLFLLDSPWDALQTDPELDRLVDYFDEHPSSIEEATGHFVSADDAEAGSQRITKAIDLLQRSGILVPDPSRAALYDEQMASSYRLHRAIPRGIADEIAAQDGLERTLRARCRNRDRSLALY